MNKKPLFYHCFKCNTNPEHKVCWKCGLAATPVYELQERDIEAERFWAKINENRKG